MPEPTPIQSPVTGSKVVNALLLWKLAIVELAIMCAITAGTFYLSGTGDEDWGQMSTAAKMRFGVGMTLAVLQLIRAFLSKTVSGLSKGDNMPPDPSNGGTGQWTRQTVVQAVQVQTDQIKTTQASATLQPPHPDGG
jgi:hypothetical protein